MHKAYKKIMDCLGDNTFSHNFGDNPEGSIEEKVLKKQGRD